MTTTEYVLSISVPYDESLHGTYNLDNFNSNYDMESLKYGYLCMHSIPLHEFYNNEIFKQWCEYSSAYTRYNTNQNPSSLHNNSYIDPSTIVKYLKNRTCIEIVKKNTIKLIDPTIDEDQRYVTTSIIKTHYIKLIQRKWKRLYKQMIMNRGNFIYLRHREIHGTWPSNCIKIL